jgi:hypothetical protein
MRRLWNNIKAAFGRVFNRYEAVYQRWGERSWLGQTLQDARLDIDSFTRKELQRRHRYWVCNSPIVNRIRCLFIQFSAGVEGLRVTPNSEKNEAWNVSRQSTWDSWARQPEINSRQSLGQACISWAGALFDDGEFFIHKIDPRTSPDRRPKIETIEAHRVETPVDLKTEENKTIFDGIKVDASGMVIGYWVRRAMLQPLNVAGNYQAIKNSDVAYDFIPASEMIHGYKVRRPGQMRGIPEGFSGMNTLHDYEDLQMLEMQAAKLASAIGNVETNPTGEVDMRGTRRSRLGVASQDQAGNIVTKNADAYYKVTLGSSHIALKAGDSLKQFQVDRPSVSQQMHWDILLNNICCAYNVPKLLVVPYSLQGTVTRADLDICANAFRFNFEILADALREVYEWVTRWAVKFDRAMDGTAPSDFLECIIRPPRAPNVDIGYTAQALELELRLGTKTLQDVYAERQQDWRHQLRQIAETRKFIHELAVEFNLEPDEISQVAELQAAAGEPDGDEDPTKAPTPQKQNA